MPVLYRFLIVISLLLPAHIFGQTPGMISNSIQEIRTDELSSTKTSYIQHQDYLSSNTTKGYKNYWGDSLKGFDEKQVHNHYLGKGLFGEELLGYIQRLKREFINAKYGLTQAPDYMPAPGNGLINGKPLGGNNTVFVAPCVNEDFELSTPGVYSAANAINGWTLSSRQSNGVCNPTNWTAGSNEFSIVATPIVAFPIIGNIPHSPLGGTRVARINNSFSNASSTRLAQTFPVTNANTLFQFAYAGYWQDGGNGHGCCDQPKVTVNMFDCLGAPLACSSLSLAPGAGCQSSGTTYTVTNGGSWTNWQVKFIDLTPYIGTCVTIEVVTMDCAFGGHYGTTFFDARCGGQLVGSGLGGVGGNVAGPVSFCQGSGVAQIAAPLGYTSYQWIAPGSGLVPAPQGTMATLTVTNPIPGTVYTVNLVAPSGCQFVATNTIVFTQVNVAGIGSSSTCANGASGSATVNGNGSGSGYNYTWLNSNSVTIGTSSTVSNLAAGVYSIILTGQGAAGCGSAVATTTVTTAPPGVISLLKPYCGGQAFLSTAGGSNFRWYNNLTPIPAPLGTASGYTVTAPCNNCIYYLSYLSNQGCQDSLRFTLTASPPGSMNTINIKPACPGQSNATAVISVTPANGSPPGTNAFSVGNSNTATPVFNASVGPTSSNTYSVTGLAAGTYTVRGFDGSCAYNSVFSITSFIHNFTLTPSTMSLCPGSGVVAGLTFTSSPSPSQYSFSWSPTTFLANNDGTVQSTIITPSIPVGSTSLIIYTVVVTPSLVNCPATRTLAITAINPPTPTINPIAPFCDNLVPFQIQVTPMGGTFVTATSGTNSAIGLNSGMLTPNSTGHTMGTNTFTYSISIFTCQATQTATYEVSHYNTAALTAPVPPLCVNHAPFNLMNIVQNTATGIWSGSVGVSNNQFNPVGLSTNNYSIAYNTVSAPNPTVCPDVSTLNVSVTHTVVPIITPLAEFCTNAAPFNLTVTPTGGTWGGNSAVSALGVLTPSLGSPSATIATYTVNIGPCVNINTLAIPISKFNTAAFSSTVPNLCVTNNPFNLMSIVQSTVNGVWSAPAAVISNSFFPSGQLTNTYATFYNTTSSPNPTLCADSQTMVIAVLNPSVPSITQVGPFCTKSNTVQLSVSPNIGQWTANAYLDINGVFNPAMAVVGNNPVQYIIGTPTCNAQQTKYIPVEAFAPATILTSIPDQCNTGAPINLLPFTLINNGIWSGSGMSGTSFDPVSAGAGNFTLTYNTSSSPSGLCPDESTIAVNVYSLASPVVAATPTLCNTGSPVKLIVSPVGGQFGGANTNAVALDGLFNPATAIIGHNIVNYSISVGPCVAYTQGTVEVVRFVSAAFAKQPKTLFCQTKDQSINLETYVENPGGTWSGSGMVPGSSIFNPILAQLGLNTVTYTTRSIPINTANLCPDISTLAIQVAKTPVVNVTPLTNTAGCVPFQPVLSINSPFSLDGSASWIPGDGSEPVTNLIYTHVYNTPGTYTATLNYMSKEGCPAEPLIVDPTFRVYEAPIADFTVPDEVFISEPQVEMTNLSTVLTDNRYLWSVSDLYSFMPFADLSPKLLFPKVGKYKVTLTAINPFDCRHEVSKWVEVKNHFNVFVPNSFSPNFDGLNDVFMPVFSNYGLDTKVYELSIFDRWGQLLYSTTDISQGWDGSIGNSGEPVKEDVYVFKLQYKDAEGNVYDKTGHVSITK